MSDILDGVALIEQGIAKIKSASGANVPVPFSSVKLLSITGTDSPFGVLGPWTLDFGSFKMVLQTKPQGLVVGHVYSGSYTPGAPVDTLNGIVSATVEVHVVITSVIGAVVQAVPTVGGALITLNFQTLPQGFAQGAVVSFSYIPAADNGTQYDEFVAMG
jgi:hypothetical protein